MNDAIARQTGKTLTHSVTIRNHELIVDEPQDLGGEDQGPTPQELLAASVATCIAITVEMYARRKGWDIGPVDVECGYTPAERGQPTVFELVLRLPSACNEEQVEKLSVIATKCPVRRTLESEIVFSERVEQRAPDAPAKPPQR
jgi:putative redox protein